MESLADLKCSMCRELPTGLIFQCKHGHAICDQCHTILKECPECRAPLDEDRIRNLMMEKLLDTLRIDCCYKASGCKKNFDRKLIRVHEENCRFRGPIVPGINICSLIGYNDCTFQINVENFPTAMEHFVEAHGCTIVDMSSLRLEFCNFAEIVNCLDVLEENYPGCSPEKSWKPIILNSDNGCAALILTIYNREDKTVSWLPINMHSKFPSQIEFEVSAIGNARDADHLNLQWSISSFNISQVGELLPSRYPLRFPAALLTKECSPEGSLFVDCTIKQGNAGKKDINGNIVICVAPEMTNLSHNNSYSSTSSVQQISPNTGNGMAGPSTSRRKPSALPPPPTEHEHKNGGATANATETFQQQGSSQASYFRMKMLEENSDLIFSNEETVCKVCFVELPKGRGIILRNCLHTFCRECLVKTVEESQDGNVICPYHLDYDCGSAIPQREIKAIVSPELFQEYLKRLRGDEVMYNEMLQMLGNTNLILTTEEMECPICFSDIPTGEGVTLRECFHSFCKDCLGKHVDHSEDASVTCPFRGDDFACTSILPHRELRALVSERVFEKYLERSLRQAQAQMANSYQCKTPDCKGWCVFEDDVNLFDCPICRKKNCIPCRAIHEGRNCKQYQEDLKISAQNDKTAKETLEFLESLIRENKALRCPSCTIVLQKAVGCDWMQCTYCKTEICWATKGPRWGKKGKGDTSGGCRCRLNGKLCHPKCGNCH